MSGGCVCFFSSQFLAGAAQRDYGLAEQQTAGRGGAKGGGGGSRGKEDNSDPEDAFDISSFAGLTHMNTQTMLSLSGSGATSSSSDSLL